MALRSLLLSKNMKMEASHLESIRSLSVQLLQTLFHRHKNALKSMLLWWIHATRQRQLQLQPLLIKFTLSRMLHTLISHIQISPSTQLIAMLTTVMILELSPIQLHKLLLRLQGQTKHSASSMTRTWPHLSRTKFRR